jgi:glutamine synthetase
LRPFETRLEACEQQILADGIEYLLIQFVDIHGSAKVKLVPSDQLRDVARSGAGFAGGAVWGMGQGPHSHDLSARPDLDTYTPLPYEAAVARFAADLYVDGQPHPFCPRINLQRMLETAHDRGFTLNVGIEPEFFLVVRDFDGLLRGWDPDHLDDLRKPCYDYKGMSGAFGFLRAMNDGLQKLGWGVYQTDHEDANYQYEINFRYSDALTTADRITFFRMMAAQVARPFGAIATFMPKPFADRTGSGAHLHFHLADAESGRNLFLDDADPQGLGLSKLCYHFLGGILRHARALSAIGSPTVNCYKRLQVGTALTGSTSGFTWVPAFVGYGDNNRTQMIRVPEGGHLEDRSVSSACNPYLTLAAYLAAGLDGIDHQIEPGPPNVGNLYEVGPDEVARRGVALLPQSLPEALDALEADPVVQGGLGPIAGEFLRLKREEWREYHSQVETWEVSRYLTVL